MGLYISILRFSYDEKHIIEASILFLEGNIRQKKEFVMNELSTRKIGSGWATNIKYYKEASGKFILIITTGRCKKGNLLSYSCELDNCMICQEKTNKKLLKCGHTMCDTCLNTYQKYNRGIKCPYCTQIMSKDKVMRLDENHVNDILNVKNHIKRLAFIQKHLKTYITEN